MKVIFGGKGVAIARYLFNATETSIDGKITPLLQYDAGLDKRKK